MKIFSKRYSDITILFFTVMFFSCIFSTAGANELSETVKKNIKIKFPGAKITETRDDTWNGQPVTEVEIVTTEGTAYELIISKDDKILDIEEEKELPIIGGELSLGAAVFMEKNIYRGSDDEIQPVPFLRYENGPFEIQTTDGLDISYTFLHGKSFSISALGQYSFEEGYDPGDSTYLSGMDELSSTYSVGLEGEYMLGGFISGIEVLQDISSEKSGLTAEFSIEYPWVFKGIQFTPGLNFSWLSKKKTDYLYGVSVREATLNRPFYRPKTSFEYGAELMIQKSF